MFELGHDEKIINLINRYGADIIQSDSYQEEKDFCQHGVISTYEHSLAVTYMSVYLAFHFYAAKYKVDNATGKRVVTRPGRLDEINLKSLVRGALLHDYYLYDWHDPSVKGRNVHGYTHARKAMNNAIRDFDINELEQRIIFCHMFPLNISRIPGCREAWIVCMADKICAAFETIKKIHYRRIIAGAGI